MTYLRNPHNPFLWESDGEYNDKFRADDGTLHDSANAAVKHNEQMRNEIHRQKSTSKMNIEELGVGLTQPAPPPQERASDEWVMRAEKFLAGLHPNARDAFEYDCDGTAANLLAVELAAAAKQAREEALEEAGGDKRRNGMNNKQNNSCEMCKEYGRPGWVINAWQWVRCWVCNKRETATKP